MMKVWIASDVTRGRMLTIEKDAPPLDVAYAVGHADKGEVIQIWKDENTYREPDCVVYWDGFRREYRKA